MSKHENLSVNEHFDKLIEPLIPSKFYADHGFDAAAVLILVQLRVQELICYLFQVSTYIIVYR